MKVSDLDSSGNTSIFKSITELVPEKSKKDALCSRSSHVIQSAINLLEDIAKNFSEEEAEYLEKKLYNSIKTRDPDKFSRLMKKL